MNFIDVQQHVRDLIAASNTFAASAATSVMIDLGFAKPALEASLASVVGYSVAVWPPSKGHSHDENSGQTGVESTVIVRLEVNPQTLKAIDALHVADNTNPAAGPWFNNLINSIVVAVLGDAPENGGVKFALAQDAFELVNFDEGLIAYHLRFNRFTVFGT